MGQKRKINNSFFDLLAFLISFLFSFFRSIKIIFIWGRKKKNIFFNFLDFVFRKWTKYFWLKPSFYKIFSFFSDLLNFLFKNNK